MTKELAAFERAGLGDNLMYIADVLNSYRVLAANPEGGVYEHVTYPDDLYDEYDDYYDEPEPVITQHAYEAGQYVASSGGEVVLLDDAMIAAQNLTTPETIEAGTELLELSHPYMGAIDENGRLTRYDPFADALDATDIKPHEIAFLDADGEMIVRPSGGNMSAVFNSVMAEQARLPFDVRALFNRVHAGMTRHVEDGSDHRQADVIALRTAIDNYGVEFDPGTARLSPASWREARAGMREAGIWNIGETRCEQLFGDGGAMMVQAQRLFAPVTNTPLRDIRVNVLSRYDAETARETFDTIAAAGSTVDLPEGYQEVLNGFYGNADHNIRIAEAGGMKAMLVEDFASANTYFFPTNPEIISQDQYEAIVDAENELDRNSELAGPGV